MIDRLLDLVWSRALGKSTRREFESHVRLLLHYLLVSELSATELARDIRLIGCKPVSLDVRQSFVSLTTLDGNTDFTAGDFVRLYDEGQLPVALAAITRTRKRTLDVSIKKYPVRSARVHYVMLDLRDVPIGVQRKTLEQILADRSDGNYPCNNLRAIQGWSARVWAAARDLAALGPRPISENNLFDKRLTTNYSMRRALTLGCRNSNSVSLLQGPPGTGKTTLIVELVQQLVLNQHKKVLLVSQGNLAVDEALERIDKASDRILSVRVGDSQKLSPAMRHLHFDWRDHDTRNALRDRLIAKGITTALRFWDANSILSMLRDEMVAREEVAKERENWLSAAAHVDVVGATCIGIGTSRAFPFSYRLFDVVILDEASRATQTEALVPLGLGRRWILVGDHRQLPPTVLTEQRKHLSEANLDSALADVSLFELMQGGKNAARVGFNLVSPKRRRVMLSVQYRMHPVIAGFISQVFYDDAEPITTGGDAVERGLNLGDFDSAICVIDTRDWPRNKKALAQIPINREERSKRPETVNSLWNPLEAWIVRTLLEQLAEASRQADKESMPQIFSKHGSEKGKITLAVITPYREHARQLQSTLASVRDWGLLLYGEDSVATIDSFQGKEKDIVIFSAVRTSRSERANLRFLEDLRRLNVAFSRARHKLFLVADGATLERADLNILSEHGKQVFARFLDRFNDSSEWQRAWRVPEEVVGSAKT